MIFSQDEQNYIGSCTTNEARVVAIDAIITALLMKAAEATADAGINEYWLNDGQTQIKAIYRDQKAIQAAVMQWESLRTMYANRVGGRVTRLMDSRNFPNGC